MHCVSLEMPLDKTNVPSRLASWLDPAALYNFITSSNNGGIRCVGGRLFCSKRASRLHGVFLRVYKFGDCCRVWVFPGCVLVAPWPPRRGLSDLVVVVVMVFCIPACISLRNHFGIRNFSLGAHSARGRHCGFIRSAKVTVTSLG